MSIELKKQFEEKLSIKQWNEFKEYAREIETNFFQHNFDDHTKLYHALQ